MAKIKKSDILDDALIIKAFNEVNEALKVTSKYFVSQASAFSTFSKSFCAKQSSE